MEQIKKHKINLTYIDTHIKYEWSKYLSLKGRKVTLEIKSQMAKKPNG
jgi:hypothetical protein